MKVAITLLVIRKLVASHADQFIKSYSQLFKFDKYAPFLIYKTGCDEGTFHWS